MKKIGLSLIFTALLIVAGLIINNHILWLIIDLAAILITGSCGILLLRKKQASPRKRK